jgi:hypothetical protein
MARARQLAGLGLAMVVTMGLASCSGNEEKVAQKAPEPLRVPVEQTTAVPVSNPSVLSGEEEVVAAADSLAPEVDVEVADTSVQPGEAVEITALASPDVRDVVLSDRMGKTASFVYDLQAKAWKTYYRIPMKHRTDRLGLSVTARNDGNRWRRVWLFLSVQDPSLSKVSGTAAPDSIH